MVNLSRTVFWAVINVLHLPILPVPWLYWRKRHQDPIKVRRPRIFIAALLSLYTSIWYILIRNLLGVPSYCALDLIIICFFLSYVCEAFFVFALTLYIAYNKTKEQLNLYQAVRDSTDTERINKTIRSIHLSSFLLSEQFAYTWIIGNTLLWTTVVLSYLWYQVGFANLMTSWSQLDENALSAGDQAAMFIFCRCLFTAFWLFVLSWRLRLVQDAFGTKALLKKCGFIAIVSVIYLIVLDQRILALSNLALNDVITILLADTAFAIAFIVPLYRARGDTRLRAVIGCEVQDCNPTRSNFESFLLTEEGFEAFKSHLEKEFSLENLLFWKDVTLFRECCDSFPSGYRSDHSINLEWKIFDKYLSKSAPLEVNLPSEHLIKFREEIFVDRSGDNSAITASIFDKSAKQILFLMEVDSLKRFLNTDPPAWRQFLALNEESMVAHQVDKLVKAPLSWHESNEFETYRSMH